MARRITPWCRPRARRLALALLLLGGCTGAPTLDQVAADIGRAEHPRVLARFGGAVDAPGLQAYVADLGARLEPAGGRAEGRIRYTVLDEPTPNAFSLPGDHVYVTRGLLAIVDDEAELAATLAHEIAHLEAGHARARLEAEQRARAGAILADVMQAPSAAPGSGRGPGIASTTGDLQPLLVLQELEADRLGTRYLAAAGYDASAMARMLERLADYDHLHRRVSGLPALAAANRLDLRIEAAWAEARALPEGGAVPRATLLAVVDGLAWGPSIRRGFVDGRIFVHPALALSFAVPPGFELASGADWAMARHPTGLLLVVDDRAVDEVRTGPRPEAAMRVVQVDTPHGARHLRFLKLGAFSTADRLAIRLVVDSLRPLPASALERMRQRELTVVEVGPEDTARSLAARMPVPIEAEALFRLLNGFEPSAEPAPGRAVKLVRWRALSRP